MNALHPDPAIDEAHRRDCRDTILLAERLGVKRVITFAGCPGDSETVDRVGVLETKPYADEANRSWIFRTVGYGHSTEFWKAMVGELRLIG
jgi:sugar phosphate isomerase/epimerase